MKRTFLIMFLVSSTVFSIEKPSRFKALKQKLFGKYLITKARENNCPNVASILEDLKNNYWKPFANIPACAKIFVQDPNIADLIRGIYLTRKHSGPFLECNFTNIISNLQGRLYCQKILKEFTKTTTMRFDEQIPHLEVIKMTPLEVIKMTHLEVIKALVDETANKKIADKTIKKNLNPFSLEQLLQKAEEKITAARSALAAAAEKEATTE